MNRRHLVALTLGLGLVLGPSFGSAEEFSGSIQGQNPSSLGLSGQDLTAPSDPSDQTDNLQVGTGIICDTADQAQTFVKAFDGDVQSTLESVNRAANSQTACGMAVVAFERQETVGTATQQNEAYQIERIVVVGGLTSAGFARMSPTIQYAVFKMPGYPV